VDAAAVTVTVVATVLPAPMKAHPQTVPLDDPKSAALSRPQQNPPRPIPRLRTGRRLLPLPPQLSP
jgi:hypothetical protein